MLRPKARVLSHSALVPSSRLIKPPPSRFTHELKRSQPYYYERGRGKPDGKFAAGTQVVLLEYGGGDYAWVADAQGLRVETAYRGLRALGEKKGKKREERRKKKER
jgi:hypothetical protein